MVEHIESILKIVAVLLALAWVTRILRMRFLTGFGALNFPNTEGLAEWRSATSQDIDDVPISESLEQLCEAPAGQFGKWAIWAPILDRLCARYPKENNEGREHIRKVAAKHNFSPILLDYIHLSAKKLKRNPDAEAVARRALAAASIEDLVRDWRECHVALDKLYTKAATMGVDPDPLFEEAILLSAPLSPPKGPPSMQAFLRSLRRQLHKERAS